MPDEDDAVAIYAAVVRQLYTVDHTFGEPPNFPVIYLLSTTNDRVGDPNAPRTESVKLPDRQNFWRGARYETTGHFIHLTQMHRSFDYLHPLAGTYLQNIFTGNPGKHLAGRGRD